MRDNPDLIPDSVSPRITASVQEQPARSPGVRYRVPRLVDIAQAAGVHVSTVSRVLNGDPAQSIRPELSQRIWSAARERGYRPNAAARALRHRRSGALGFVVPAVSNSSWARVRSGALRRADERGYLVMIVEEQADDSSPADGYCQLIEESRADGLILAISGVLSKPGTKIADVPHVFVNSRGPLRGNDVIMDESAAALLFADYVADLGHRSIALIDGPAEVESVGRRVTAFRSVFSARGISLTVRHAAPTEEGGWDAAEPLIRRSAPPTACAVGHLSQLLGVQAALRKASVEVPAQMSLVSLEEDERLPFLSVPVTSVCMPLAELGSAAVDALVARIDGLQVSDVVIGKPIRLLHRGSAGPPPR